MSGASCPRCGALRPCPVKLQEEARDKEHAVSVTLMGNPGELELHAELVMEGGGKASWGKRASGSDDDATDAIIWTDPLAGIYTVMVRQLEESVERETASLPFKARLHHDFGNSSASFIVQRTFRRHQPQALECFRFSIDASGALETLAVNGDDIVEEEWVSVGRADLLDLDFPEKEEAETEAVSSDSAMQTEEECEWPEDEQGVWAFPDESIGLQGQGHVDMKKSEPLPRRQVRGFRLPRLF